MQLLLRMRMHERGAIDLAEISLDCHRRFARFLGQILGWHNCCRPHGNQIPLRHIRDQHHGLCDYWLLSGLPRLTHGVESGLEVFGPRRLCGGIQHVFHF
jgi:hypothetical protein